MSLVRASSVFQWEECVSQKVMHLLGAARYAASSTPAPQGNTFIALSPRASQPEAEHVQAICAQQSPWDHRGCLL